MKAITFDQFGEPEVLTLNEVPEPKPTADQLLVRVYATALNRADILQRRGKYPPPPGESEILGLEIAGEVVSWGKNVSGFVKGQRVFGLVAGGGYAQYCLLDKEMAMTIPEHWSFAQAAAVPEAFFTANETVFELGQLQSGESILIHAGASGVGTAAVQMAHSLGAKVFFTAGSQDKINQVLALGADVGINYKTQDFAAVIAEQTQGQGVDVIEDFAGADYFARNLQSLKLKGRLILVATMTGAQAEIDIRLVMSKRLQIKGSVLRSRTLQEKREVTQRFSERWLPLLAAGKIKPVIDSIYPMEQVQQAHHRMEANLNFGKIVLDFED